MKITINPKNFDLDEKTKQLVNDRLAEGLDHLLRDFDPNLLNATVKIEQFQRHGYQVNFSMSLPGNKQIFAKEEDDKLSLALSKLREDVERQLETITGKLKDY
ncbi:hypothetical protein GF362_07440 [Candidatus Dojkabacteria bacterium]|nr:hypothetical protein [Candidatus Dojkabacteria bacterium]